MYSHAGDIEVHCADCGSFIVSKPDKCCPRCQRKDAIFLPTRYDQEKAREEEKHPKPKYFQDEPK